MKLKGRFSKHFLILSLLAIIAEIIYLASVSYPPSFAFLLRKSANSVLVSLKSAHKDKANIYLQEAVRLEKHLESLQKKNPQDPSLGVMSEELLDQELMAIGEMDQAKLAGVNIKDQVSMLCDTMLKQLGVINVSLLQPHPNAREGLQLAFDATKLHLMQSMGW